MIHPHHYRRTSRLLCPEPLYNHKGKCYPRHVMRSRRNAPGDPSPPNPSPANRAARRELASAIRQARLAAGLTQEALALQVGFANYKPVWLIESGRMPIPPEKVGALEALLGFPPNTLFWKECRCRLLGVGFDVDRALEEEPQAVSPAEPKATNPPILAEGRNTMDQLEQLSTGATDLRSNISQQIRQSRQKLHLSQERIAQLAGFRGKEPIWLIEHGRMAIPPERLLPLAQVLGLDPHELLLAEIRCRLQAMGFDDALLSAAEVLLPGPLSSQTSSEEPVLAQEERSAP